MAEKTILVCDVCGRPAAETVTIKASRGNFVKDMCATHVNELVAGAYRDLVAEVTGANMLRAGEEIVHGAGDLPGQHEADHQGDELDDQEEDTHH